MPPQTPALFLEIHKVLRYTGPTVATGTAIFDLIEYPTTVPEPSALLLLGISALALLVVHGLGPATSAIRIR